MFFLPSKLSRLNVRHFAEKAGKFSLDPLATRQKLPSELRVLLSRHLLNGLDQLAYEDETATANSAWRYEQLLEWGESSAVAILAEHMKVNVGTMRARLAQARLNGMLDSPGRGSRKTK